MKAEISKKEQEFAKNKVAGKTTTVGRPDKKPTIWARQNKGVKDRASRDIEFEAINQPTLESTRAALERKAKIYDKLRRGKSGGLNDKQYEALLVDFDSKPVADNWESDSDDVDESLTVPRPPDDDQSDPIVEYVDEFGRQRTARRSEVPREFLVQPTEPDEDEDLIIRNPVGHFPVYEPSEERLAEIAKAQAEQDSPLNLHYDASREVRAKGAGFYQFSTDEDIRRAQMEELRLSREETEKARKESGALDVKPGDIEGMQGSGMIGQSKAMEKRKREIEERRKLLYAKRRKVQPDPQVPSTSTPPTKSETVAAPDGPFVALGPRSTMKEADDFLAQLENDLKKK